MISKKVRNVALAIFGLFLLFGCLGSGSSDPSTPAPAAQAPEAQAPADPAPATPTPAAQTPAPATPAQTPTPAPANQDVEWLQSTMNYCNVIGPDCSRFGQAATAGDLELMYYYAIVIKSDVGSARSADSRYVVSEKYSLARQEWRANLDDLESAMDLVIRAANEGWTDPQPLSDANEKMLESLDHLTRFSAYIEAA